MINLPRLLIYQDRQDIEDYIVGNELNQALYDALKSIKHPSFIQRLKGVPALSDDDILRIFNDAYYLCIVMSNEELVIPYEFLHAKFSSEYAWQVALAILSQQHNRCWRFIELLQDFRGTIKEPIKVVLENFECRNIIYDMNLDIRLPDIDTLELDWEIETRGFDKAIIEGILYLWKDIEDKLKVCRKIYEAFRHSPRRDMPYMHVDCGYFENMMYPWEYRINQRKWEEEMKMQGRWDWENDCVKLCCLEEDVKQEEPPVEVNPVSEEEETLQEEEYMPDVCIESKRKSIFVDKLNDEDLSRRKEETDRFMRFIRKQKWEETILTSKQDNVVCLTFVAFCREWHNRGWIPEKPNRGACYRFLCDDCKFELSVKERGFQNFIAGMLDGVTYSIDDKLKEISPLVAAMF